MRWYYLLLTALAVAATAPGICNAQSKSEPSKSAAASARKATPGFVYKGKDDKAAARALGAFLKQIGIAVDSVEEANVFITYRNAKYQLSPLTQELGLDRIVAIQAFAVKDQYKGKDQVIKWCNRLNNENSLGAFSVDNTGDLTFSTHMTYVDSISKDYMITFLGWLSPAVETILASDSGAMTYIDR